MEPSFSIKFIGGFGFTKENSFYTTNNIIRCVFALGF